MRSRGAYRQTSDHLDPTAAKSCMRGGLRPSLKVVDHDIQVIDHLNDIEFVEVKPRSMTNSIETNGLTSKKLKTSPKWVPKPATNTRNSISVITIDSDDDLEEMTVFTNDSDYSSASATTAEIIEEERAVTIAVSTQKCQKCRRPLTDVDYKYDHLTSADFYANPRAHPSVIPLELKDRNRFNAFNEALRHNKELFRDKNVLVVGSANGLLALLVGQVMPSTVIVFDRPGISEIVETIIQRNRFKLPNKSTKYFVMRDSLDKMVLPNGLKKVDIIVSDWANHSLFFKSMINHFIKARDKFLRYEGLIFPDRADLYLAAAHDNVHNHATKKKIQSESNYIKRVDYWDKNVYGFDMRAIRKRVASEPIHEYISRSQVITNELVLKSFDLYRISQNDLTFRIPFELSVTKKHYLQTFVLFFDVLFTRSLASDMFSTRPSALKTMFRPTIFFVEFEKHLALEKNDRIKGRFRYRLNRELNRMTVDIDFEFKNKSFDVKQRLAFASD